MKTEKKFHVTWFVDAKKAILAGKTIQAENIAIALLDICSQNIPKDNNTVVTLEDIKYIIEI